MGPTLRSAAAGRATVVDGVAKTLAVVGGIDHQKRGGFAFVALEEGADEFIYRPAQGIAIAVQGLLEIVARAATLERVG